MADDPCGLPVELSDGCPTCGGKVENVRREDVGEYRVLPCGHRARGPVRWTIQRAVAWQPISDELAADRLPPWDDMMAMLAEKERAFNALPPEEQERIRAEEKAAYEAQRCEHCGCQPDEHGG